jgi:SAM-dependent methyltransferase
MRPCHFFKCATACRPLLLQRLAEILQLLPGLDGSKRIIDVGSGTGCLIPHLRARGVKDILAVDLSPVMLQQLAARYPPPSTVGNDSGTADLVEPE